MPSPPRMLLVLSENWTLTGGRADLPAAVRWAREAEDAGFDAVMVSEHIVLGPDAAAAGIMGNPRDYALPGNQDPHTPWPNSLMLLAAIASVTSRLRLAAAAVLAPLRHPLLLARELGTLDLISEGRLVVQPTVSWSRDEYDALGVPFTRRGRLLDEHLEVWAKAWGPSPLSHDGPHYPFRTSGSSPRRTTPTAPGSGSAASACTARSCAASSSTATASTRSAGRRPRTSTGSRRRCPRRGGTSRTWR
ncbi:LLM class flavin-dependent oxidoreductase [Streptomyces massasporeus]|uniref:LLM class flavin-dependent oxidoreductase n=1 Tax=Streptomyces massasporeus TaxID=67324 RepID=UPI003802CAFC